MATLIGVRLSPSGDIHFGITLVLPSLDFNRIKQKGVTTAGFQNLPLRLPNAATSQPVSNFLLVSACYQLN